MDTVRRKVNVKDILDYGAIVMEKAEKQRECICGLKIEAKTKHLAIYRPNGKYSASRFNFCRQCSGRLIREAAQRLSQYERQLFGQGGA